MPNSYTWFSNEDAELVRAEAGGQDRFERDEIENDIQSPAIQSVVRFLKNNPEYTQFLLEQAGAHLNNCEELEIA